MTPQYIMRAGLQDYLKGHQDEAGNHVKQHPNANLDTPEYHLRSAESQIENLDWYENYSDDSSNAKKGILVADWNHVSRRTQNILESYGFEIDWNDELVRCDHCNKAARTSPQCYGDLSTAIIDKNGDSLCCKCAVNEFPEDIVEACVNKPRKAVKYSEIDLTKFGFELKQDGYQNGFHPGQTDDPSAIFKQIKTDDIDVIFRIEDAGQFDVTFSVWTRPVDFEESED